jgi:cell division protein FtsZ
MHGHGDALMGIGEGTGSNRAEEAALKAVKNPLLEGSNIEGSSNILVSITGGEDLSLPEVEEVIQIITANVDPEALIIFGTSEDLRMEDSICVTMIATGFQSENISRVNMDASKKPSTDKQSDFINYGDFQRFTERSKASTAFLSTRNFGDDDLDIPTVMRDPRYRTSESNSASGSGPKDA